MKWCLLLACASLCAEPYVVKDYAKLTTMNGFEEKAVKLHLKLYEGYVTKTNELLAKLQSLSDGNLTASLEYGALKRRLGWEFDGMRLHELYFDQLGGNGKTDNETPLYSAISAQFGGFDRWKKDFIATGMMRGVGWAILYYDPQDGRLVNTWINEHDTGHLATGTPILIMDVFEHAYMPQWGLDRAAYINAFFNNLDWRVISNRFSETVDK